MRVLILAILLAVSPFFLFAQWEQNGIQILGEEAYETFGYSLSFDKNGNTLAVGAPFSTGDSYDEGAVRVYELVDGDWVQKGATIFGSTESDTAGIGVDLSDDGNTLVIGNFQIEDLTGKVVVYEFNGNDWVQKGSELFGEQTGDYFGQPVAINGDGSIIVAGSFQNDNNGEDAGYVKVFQFDNGDWSQMSTNIEGEEEEYLGYSVDLDESGLTLVVGIPGSSGFPSDGKTKVFQFDGDTWQQLGSEIGADTDGERSGTQVAINAEGNIIAIGSPGNASAGFVSGGARVFVLQDGEWVQKGETIPGQIEEEKAGIGIALSDDGNTVLVGAPFNDVNGMFSGAARIYQFCSNAWQQVADTWQGEEMFDLFGHRLVINSQGNRIAIAARESNNFDDNAGYVEVYERSYFTLEDGILTATVEGADYQWLNCEDMSSVEGEEFQVFSPTINGEYALMITTPEGCESVSDCVEIDNLPDNISESELGIVLYPNPNTGIFNLLSPAEWSTFEMRLYAMDGREIIRNTVSRQHVNTFDLQLQSGVYILMCRSNGITLRQRVVIE